MSREACGDPPEQEPQRCPVCDGEWHAEGCELGEEVSRRLKAETEARTLRCRYAVVSGWIVEALKVLDTLDPEDATEAEELGKLIKAGEVLALTALAQSKTPNVRGNAHLTAAQEVEALREVLELCAAGDVDESTEALGWGEVILRAKQALERSTAEAAQPTRSQKLADAGYTRRPSLWAMQAREALELIAVPARPDGTWNRDRAACQQIAAEALGRAEDEAAQKGTT